MSSGLLEISSEKSLIYAQQALLLAEKLNNQKGISDALFYIASSYYRQDNYPKALDYFKKAAKFYKSSGETASYASCLTTTGSVYYEFGDYENALQFYLDAYKVYEKNYNRTGLATTLVNIGIVYIALNYYDEGFKKYQEAIQLANQLDNPLVLGSTYHNLGAYYKKVKNYEMAVSQYKEAIKTFSNTSRKKELSNAYNGLAEVYKARGEINKALSLYLQAQEIEKDLKDQKGLTLSQMGIGEVYYAAKNYKRSKDYFEQSLKTAVNIGNKVLIRDTYQRLSITNERMGDVKASLENYKMFKVYNDSIYNEKRLAQLAEMRFRFEVDAKQKEINSLTSETQTQKEKIEEKDKNIRLQTILIILFSGIITLVALLLYLTYRSRVKIQQVTEQLRFQNEEINRQKTALEAQSEQLGNSYLKITDSIRYAQTIQNSILPDKQKMKEVFNEYFLISKPKEIVAGDFYWIYQSGGYKFVAVVDCTGHGVAGGFMSMIGYALLNEIVIQNEEYQPSEILRKLHEEVINVLEKRQPGINVGMEAIICRIEPENKETHTCKVIVSGAKRPLFYMSVNGVETSEKEIIELKCDRLPIGYYVDEHRAFNDFELNLGKGSILYLTTDGYVDQANRVNKRLGTPMLKNFLAELAPKTLEVQKTKLEEKLKNYQSGSSQRDDITILGIKL